MKLKRHHLAHALDLAITHAEDAERFNLSVMSMGVPDQTTPDRTVVIEWRRTLEALQDGKKVKVVV